MYRANQRNAFFKPENALQRAEELLEVDAPLEALSVLSESLVARRSRNVPATSLEPLITRYLTLAVSHRRFSQAREALHYFKNIALSTSVPSIERVVKYFIDFSEERLNEVYDESSDLCLIEDLESLDTLKSHFLNIITLVEESGSTAESLPQTMTTKERGDESFTMRLKYLWEAYRLVLEMLRNNSKLEALYQQTAAAAFAFCVRYKRKVEFRRLCETLRSHVTSVRRATNSPVAINMSDTDVLQRFLDTRFLQMQTASDLEMWQECFRSAEDIYELLIFAAEKICFTNSLDQSHCEDLLPVALLANKNHGQRMMQMLVQYYEKLTKVFAKSEDGFFLAAAWSKYYSWYSKLVKEELASVDDLRTIANNYILAALASPVFSDDKGSDFSSRFNRKDRLTKMLSWNGSTDRQALLLDPNFRLALNQCSPIIQEVFMAIEVEFHPLTSARRVRQILQNLSDSDLGLVQYVPMLRNAAIIKTLRQVSSFYSAISFSALQEMTSVTAENQMSLFVLEKIIILGNQKGHFSIRIDHVRRRFVLRVHSPKTNIFNILRVQVANAEHEREKAEAFEAARRLMEAENIRNAKRQEIIESLKIKVEEPAPIVVPEIVAPVKVDRSHEEAQALKAKLEAEMLASKRAALEKEQRRINSLEARKNADILRSKAGFIIKHEDLEKLSSSEVDYLYSEHLKHDRAQLNERMKKYAERADYMERAFRHYEIPLLKKASVAQAERDKNLIIETRRRLVAQSKEKHANDVKLMNRVEKMQEEAKAYREKFYEKYREEIQREVKSNEEALRKAKIRRRCYVRDQLLIKIKEANEEKVRRAEQEKQEEIRRVREAAEQEKKRIEEEEQKRKENAYVIPALRPGANAPGTERGELRRPPTSVQLAAGPDRDEWFKNRQKASFEAPEPTKANYAPQGGRGPTTINPGTQDSWRNTSSNEALAAPAGRVAPQAYQMQSSEKPHTVHKAQPAREFTRENFGHKAEGITKVDRAEPQTWRSANSNAPAPLPEQNLTNNASRGRMDGFSQNRNYKDPKQQNNQRFKNSGFAGKDVERSW